MTIESFLGGPRPRVRRGWAAFRASASMTTCARRSPARARRRPRGHPLEPAVLAAARPLRLSRARLHAGDAAREGLGRGRGPLPQDRVLAGAALRRRWPSSTTSTPTGATGSRCRAGTRPAGTSSPSGSRTSASSCGRCRRSPSTRPGAARRGSRSTAISSTAAASTARPEALVHQRVELRWDRDRVWIEHRGQTRRRLRAQLRARASGSRRRGCGPSRRRSPR